MCVKQRDLLCWTLSMGKGIGCGSVVLQPSGLECVGQAIPPESSGHSSLKAAVAHCRGCLPQSDHCLPL